jgi:predicted DNA-binding protein (MmcQ/YjbR family)
MKTSKSRPKAAKKSPAKSSPSKPKRGHASEEKLLAAFANKLPEAHEDFPWGHRAVKVKGKAFIFMAMEEATLSLSVKLPRSGDFALMQDFASPTGYGLGKSGWVTAAFGPGKKVPLDLLKEWIVESYRAIAPKKLSCLLG